MNKKEKEGLMDMMYKYEERFYLRDETGTWPYKEIDVTDISPFSLDHTM